METSTYQIHAFWDTESTVWVATSDDVPGLVTEATSLEELNLKLRQMIPELLVLNQVIAKDYCGFIAFELISQKQEIIQVAS